jgi:flavin reductase (DIM6/NTAB) family NADH-FMN oxidoreductase RutF
MGFAVNLLHERAQGVAELFASPVRDRFAQVAWDASGGVPVLVDDAFATAECRVSSLVPAGDHVVIFGTVVRVSHAAENPLMYGRRRFGAWPE